MAKEELKAPSKRMYRALIGFPGINSAKSKKGKQSVKMSKSQEAAYNENIMRTALKHWDNREPHDPYPYPMIDPDKFYEQLVKRPSTQKALPDGMSIDSSPQDVLNFFGAPNGIIFMKEKPARLKKTDKRKPSKYNGLYAYTIMNPDGQFDSYNYPIQHCWDGIGRETSTIVDQAFGTYHDMTNLTHFGWEHTWLPDVLFIVYKEKQEDSDAIGGQCAATGKNTGKPDVMVFDMLEKSKDASEEEWAAEAKAFYTSHLDYNDYIAMIECKL